MFWNSKNLKLKHLPNAPQHIKVHKDTSEILYCGWLWKKHPLFNKWTERIMVITH